MVERTRPPDHVTFGKTEVRVEGIELRDVSLAAVARAIATVLEVDPEEVYVIDARDDRLAVDVRCDLVDPRAFAGRHGALVEAIGRVDGVTTTDATRVHSDGVIGWLAADRDDALQALDRADQMRDEIRARIRRRALVLSTGTEIVNCVVDDTNQPFLISSLLDAGFLAERGGVVDDDLGALVARFADAVDQGFGVVVSTGGVGAEEKDKTVEALLALDPDAATPVIAEYVGGHRHHKSAVRIGVGVVGVTTLIAIPGPHDEVRVAWPVIRTSLLEGVGPSQLASRLATTLRALMAAKFPAMTTGSHH